MSHTVVLDSYAVIAFLENERGAEIVKDVLTEAKKHNQPLLLSLINWGEVYYICHREYGQKIADEILIKLKESPIEIVSVDQELTFMAASIKATKKMSYADCFAAALAKRKKASLVTGDKEFKEVEKEIKIIWL